MNALERIQNQGIKIFIHDGRLKLEPLQKITPSIVAEARANKTEIVQTLKNNQHKPDWCLSCEGHWYKQLDGMLTLFCNMESEAVYYLNKCPSGYWIKDKKGWPHTLNEGYSI